MITLEASQAHKRIGGVHPANDKSEHESRVPRLTVREIAGRDADWLMRRVFALRYRVYCIERDFLSADDYPDGLETDEFDRLSTHFCAMDETGTVVGAVRLIRPPRGVDFPLRGRCALYEAVKPPPRTDCAEVSRLVVPRSSNRRVQNRVDHAMGPMGRMPAASAPLDLASGHAARSQIVLNLYRAIYRYSRRTGICCWYAAMEPSLVRALKRYAFEFDRIGPDADYFGTVAPYLAPLDELERRVGEADPELLRWFKQA